MKPQVVLPRRRGFCQSVTYTASRHYGIAEITQQANLAMPVWCVKGIRNSDCLGLKTLDRSLDRSLQLKKPRFEAGFGIKHCWIRGLIYYLGLGGGFRALPTLGGFGFAGLFGLGFGLNPRGFMFLRVGPYPFSGGWGVFDI